MSGLRGAFSIDKNDKKQFVDDALVLKNVSLLKNDDNTRVFYDIMLSRIIWRHEKKVRDSLFATPDYNYDDQHYYNTHGASN
ncbi:hypothetical protein JDBNIEOD_00948 [Streptococcus equi subsp. zooepidemicus]|uniref:Uncharacterized protein n=1 Tax=Streptococcus equi subsp. ruminatorum CECT 5772 TaxID=1051981 RepID=A0A922NTN4_9STRE|nr:hypothetical protein CECT5772_07789 [Streptococcus equi subsp. ruminatorum CECT 5772]QUQ77921.1 hypothetical protein JDBNIEOD_00948 [Streptococcus equi subsp. zooepidemicus]QUQ80153.1 hypothetical protein LJFMMFNO_01161 [Streptococcus equi subsp. zooepidemicus]